MINDPEVSVDCDGCSTVESVDLTPIAQRSWDQRNVAAALRGLGWSNTPDKSDFWYCPDCSEERKAKGKRKGVGR